MNTRSTTQRASVPDAVKERRNEVKQGTGSMDDVHIREQRTPVNIKQRGE